MIWNVGISAGRTGVARMGWRVLAVAGLLAWLTGCANSFSAQLSRYEAWPADAAGASYWIQPASAQENNLQFQTYADSVRAALGPTGLVQAAAPADARFTIHLDYASQSQTGWTQQLVDPFFPGPMNGFHGHWGGFYGGGPWWGGGMAVQTVPVAYYALSLQVRIDDQTQQGKEVYRATAVARSAEDRLDDAMPYLARALFDAFPGQNGQVIDVEYPLP